MNARTKASGERSTTTAEVRSKEKKIMFDFSQATLADVPKIAHTIRALRALATKSQVATTKTQSLILRTVPPMVLSEVALLLADEPSALAVLSGEKVGR
ncbi:MAG: hypothetical protein ACHP8A_14130 [Terriglobales bacterium]|jgi:hypothetical protein